MLSLLGRRPAFRRLWFAVTVSLIGDWLGFVAVSLLALDQGGGVLALALVFVAHSVPHALFTPIGGVLVDRLDRRRLLIAVPLVQALLTVAMALAAARGALGLVQAFVLVRTAGTGFMLPAEAAALRHTVEPHELVRANAILSGTWSVTYVAGMALGGVLAGLGPVPAILVDACSFLSPRRCSGACPRCRPCGRTVRRARASARSSRPSRGTRGGRWPMCSRTARSCAPSSPRRRSRWLAALAGWS